MKATIIAKFNPMTENTCNAGGSDFQNEILLNGEGGECQDGRKVQMGQAVSAENGGTNTPGLYGNSLQGGNSVQDQEGTSVSEREAMEKQETMNCVKNKIDVLIEGCLLAQNSDELWHGTSTSIPLESTEGNTSRCNGDSDNTKLNALSSAQSDSKTNTDCIFDSKGDNSGGLAVDKKDLCLKREDSESSSFLVKSEVKQEEGDHPVKMEPSSVKTESEVKIENLEKPSKTAPSKVTISDLVKDSENNKPAQIKNMTTFQTFIEQVLDSSLQQVSASMTDEKPTNILERCNETENKPQKPSVLEKKPCVEDKVKRESMVPAKTESQKTILPSGKERLGVSKTQMVSLKDHIEKLLEQNFQTTGQPSALAKFEDGRKRNYQALSSSTSNSHQPLISRAMPDTNKVSAPGFVSTVINNSIKMNEMLTPSQVQGRLKDSDAHSPNVGHHRHEIEPGEIPPREHPPRYMQYSDHSNMTLRGPSTSPRMPFVPGHDRFRPEHGVHYQPNSLTPHAFPHGAVSPRAPVHGASPKFESRDHRFDQRDVRRDPNHHDSRELRGDFPAQVLPIHRKDTRIPPSSSHAVMNNLHPQHSPIGYHGQQLSPRIVVSMSPQAQHQMSQESPGVGHGHGLIGEPQERSPVGHGSQQTIHLRDCTCPSCVPSSRHPGGHHVVTEMRPQLPELHPGMHPQRSSNISSHHHPLGNMTPGHRGNMTDQLPAMMRPSHSQVPPGLIQHPMPKLLPTHPPITSPKEFNAARVPVQHNSQAVPGGGQGHRLVVPDRFPSPAFSPHHTEERARSGSGYPGYPEGSKDDRLTPKYPGEFITRPSSTPSHDSSRTPSQRDGTPYQHQPRPTNQSPRSSILDLSAKTSPPPQARSSEESPLDLSCKKTSPVRARSQSFSTLQSHQQPPANGRKGNVNTFIKRIEDSVDKYFHAKSSTPTAPQQVISPPQQHMNQSVHHHEIKLQGLPLQGFPPRQGITHGTPHPSHAQPQSQVQQGPQMQQLARFPNVTVRPGIPQPQQYKPGGGNFMQMQAPNLQDKPQFSEQSPIPPRPVAPQQAPIAQAQPAFDANDPTGRTKKNNVSKHEPIQNIIGSHNPNDILYLFCRICSQTYGSPYGFRKHFRNQHGFEPRAEHAIVQTISATKSALHAPPNVPVGIPQMEPGLPVISQPPLEPQGMPVLAASRSNCVGPSTGTLNSQESVVPKLVKEDKKTPPLETKSYDGEHEKEDSVLLPQDKNKDEQNGETKFLECPECGKTFQLNDFGSYKRHCRQHSHMKISGPYSCSECPLSFPEQHQLKEHFTVHLDNSSGVMLMDKNKLTTNSDLSCVQCDQVCIDMNQYHEHMQAHHDKSDQPPKLSPQIDLKKSNVGSNQSPVPKSDDSHAESGQSELPNLNVIPCHSVVRQAAESNTTAVCPDSSSEIVSRVIVSSGTDKSEDKVDDITTETADSGYSSSIGSISTLSAEDKLSERSEKSPGMDILRQKSVDSAMDVSDDKNSDDFGEFNYKHKKFCGHRKRENSLTVSESSVVKKPKISPSDLEINMPVSSSTTNLKDINGGDSLSSMNLEKEFNLFKDRRKKVDSDDNSRGSNSDDACSEKSVGSEKSGSGGKAEARHNLPFVWDRVTRSQVGRKSKAT